MSVGPLSQVHISVGDVDRSVEFYRDVLQIPFLFRVPEQPMAFFRSGDVRLYLGVPETPDFAGRATLYFRVDDLDAEHARLCERGVEFLDGPHLVHRDEVTELWMAFFRDPDGNNLALTSERPPTPTG